MAKIISFLLFYLIFQVPSFAANKIDEKKSLDRMLSLCVQVSLPNSMAHAGNKNYENELKEMAMEGKKLAGQFASPNGLKYLENALMEPGSASIRETDTTNIQCILRPIFDSKSAQGKAILHRYLETTERLHQIATDAQNGGVDFFARE